MSSIFFFFSLKSTNIIIHVFTFYYLDFQFRTTFSEENPLQNNMSGIQGGNGGSLNTLYNLVVFCLIFNLLVRVLLPVFIII